MFTTISPVISSDFVLFKITVLKAFIKYKNLMLRTSNRAIDINYIIIDNIKIMKIYA